MIVDVYIGTVVISIHALRKEGDCKIYKYIILLLNFYPRPPRGGRHEELNGLISAALISIHALREEGDRRCRMHRGQCGKFLSTPSARRATACPNRLPA